MNQLSCRPRATGVFEIMDGWDAYFGFNPKGTGLRGRLALAVLAVSVLAGLAAVRRLLVGSRSVISGTDFE